MTFFAQNFLFNSDWKYYEMVTCRRCHCHSVHAVMIPLYAVHALESVGLENHQILKKRAGSNVTTIKRVFLKSVKEK